MGISNGEGAKALAGRDDAPARGGRGARLGHTSGPAKDGVMNEYM